MLEAYFAKGMPFFNVLPSKGNAFIKKSREKAIPLEFTAIAFRFQRQSVDSNIRLQQLRKIASQIYIL